MSSAPFLLEVLGVASPHRRDRQVDYYFCRSAEVTRAQFLFLRDQAEPEREGSLKGQSANCSTGLPDNLPAYRCPLPFLCESRGTETRFINLSDPEPGPSLWTARRRQGPMPCAPWATAWWSQAAPSSSPRRTGWCRTCRQPSATWPCRVNYASTGGGADSRCHAAR